MVFTPKCDQAIRDIEWRALENRLHNAAKSILSLAKSASIPDSYWDTDRRIVMACDILGLSVADAMCSDWSVYHLPEVRGE